MGNDNLNIEELEKIFLDKYEGYLELMRVAGCSDEELDTKKYCKSEFNNLSTTEKKQVILNDLNFLNFFTSGGIVMVDDSGRRLYSGINKEIAHYIMCTMSSMKQNVELPEEYKKEIEEPIKLYTVKDQVSFDMVEIFPDMKKMFFLGQKEDFHNRMSELFSDSSEIEEFSDIVDESVLNNREVGLIKYNNMVENAKNISKEIDFNKKGLNL